MLKKLQEIREMVEQELNEANLTDKVQELKVKYLGKKGELTQISRSMGSLSAEERPIMGQKVNEVRSAIETMISQRLTDLEEAALSQKLRMERIDVTLPGRPVLVGGKHPLTQVIDEIKDIFFGYGLPNC